MNEKEVRRSGSPPTSLRFWGDTDRMTFPLGNFQGTGASSRGRVCY
jgi:hypothetical protein